MVSNGPSTQSNNFTHMFDFVDLRGNNSEKKYDSNSIMSIINNTRYFSKFKYIVKKALMDDILASQQANFTLFIPTDIGIGNKNLDDIDVGAARQIVKSCMLDRKITSELLEDSPSSFFKTNDPYNRIFVRNIGGITYINDDIKIIHKDIIRNNGIIHITNKLLEPKYLN
jgi:uncharacterized surface protein with fasciclin (FAS1) repeats